MLLNLNFALLKLFFSGTSIAKLVHPRQCLLSQFLGTNKSLISQPVDDLQPADISEYRETQQKQGYQHQSGAHRIEGLIETRRNGGA